MQISSSPSRPKRQDKKLRTVRTMPVKETLLELRKARLDSVLPSSLDATVALFSAIVVWGEGVDGPTRRPRAVGKKEEERTNEQTKEHLRQSRCVHVA